MLHNTRLTKDQGMASDGVDFELRLAMAAGGGSRVWCEAEAVEDRGKRQDGHEENGNVEVAELGHSSRVAVRVSDQAQGDGADGDANAHAELHDGAEEAIGPAHPAGRNLRIGERGHAGELHGPAGSVKEEDGDDE